MGDSMRGRVNGRDSANAAGRSRGRGHAFRLTLRDGLEAALKADPEVIATCKPKTGVGGLVQGMMHQASKGRITTIKLILELLDEEDEAEDEPGEETEASEAEKIV